MCKILQGYQELEVNKLFHSKDGARNLVNLKIELHIWQ